MNPTEPGDDQLMGGIDGTDGAMSESVKYLNSFVDVAETYSPPRVTEHATNHKEMGVRPGWAMDLMTGFDFTKPQDQARAWTYVKESKPVLVIGSPACTMFSSLQNWNGHNGTH